MDLRSALYKLRRGELLEKTSSVVQKNSVSGKEETSTQSGSSLFTVDDWDSLDLDDDDLIFKEDDGISFSPPQSQLDDGATRMESSSWSNKNRENFERTHGSENMVDSGVARVIKQGTNGGKDITPSSSNGQINSVQKLIAFQFVKKRDKDKHAREDDNVGMPPAKKIAAAALVSHSGQHNDMFNRATTTDSGTSGSGTANSITTVTGPVQNTHEAIASYTLSSRGSRHVTQGLTIPLHSKHAPLEVLSYSVAPALSPLICHNNLVSSSATSGLTPKISTTSSLHSDILTSPKRPPTITTCSSSSAPCEVTLATPSRLHSLSASMRATYSRLTDTPSLPSSVTRSRGSVVSSHSTLSNPPSYLRSNKSTPIPSTPQNSCSSQLSTTLSSDVSGEFTPSVSMAMSSTPRMTSLAVSCPSRRPCLSTPISAVICTPGNTTSGSEMEILKTPIPVPQRKFPGPAGLLPRLAPGQSMDSIHIAPPSTPTPVSTPRLLRIPSSHIVKSSETMPSSGDGTSGDGVDADNGDFGQGPWVEMLQDLDLNDSHCSALLDYSIAQAVKQFSSKKLRNNKVVHLRVVLKSISLSGRSASGVLKDPTGEIMCALHDRVLDEYKKQLQVGAVLVLRQVSMFSPGPRRQYLNVTPANVVRIYPPYGTINTDSPLVLSELERLQSLDSEDLGFPPPIPVPYPPRCKLMKTQPLHSPLFSPSSNRNLGQGSRMMEENRQGSRMMEENRQGSRIMEENRQGSRMMEENRQGSRMMEENRQGSRIMEENRQGSRMMEENRQGSRMMEENRHGNMMMEENRSRLEMVLSHVRSVANTKTGRITSSCDEAEYIERDSSWTREVQDDVVYGSCDPSIANKHFRDSFGRISDPVVTSSNASGTSRLLNVGSSRSYDIDTDGSCDIGASRSCDTDVMFLTDIREDEFNDLFSDMTD